MISIYKKEIVSFLSSLIGVITIAVFLLVTGLFLWIFPSTSIIEYGYATLESFFQVAPYIFMFLIPAITMQSFSEEINRGTIELLYTRPVRETGIILGKYFAAFTLVVLALIPTLIYFYSVSTLGSPQGNIDTGGVWGSYIGLLFLGGAFVAIGVFSSALTKNQIVAFILAVFLCYFFYDAFTHLAKLDVFFGSKDYLVELLGMSSHYSSMGKGVLDTRDIIYFLSVIVIFILLTKTAVESRKW